MRWKYLYWWNWKDTLSNIYSQRTSIKTKNPVIVRKFYKNHFDEHCLTEHYFKNLILDKNRINALKKAENNNFDVAILDDGYQDYRIKKDLNILCFNSNQMLGNGLVFLQDL